MLTSELDLDAEYALRRRIERLEAENSALRDRAKVELNEVRHHVSDADYFRAFKLVKEGRISDALSEMEKTLDDRASGWRGWI